MDAQTFVLPIVENLVPTLRHSLSGQKMLSKLYSSCSPLAASLMIAAPVKPTPFWLTPTNIVDNFPTTWSLGNDMRGGGGGVVKVLSPWRPKLSEISSKTAKFSRNYRTGIDVHPLAALVKWPSGGESRTTAALAKKTPGSQTSCPWASEKSRSSQDESRKLV